MWERNNFDQFLVVAAVGSNSGRVQVQEDGVGWSAGAGLPGLGTVSRISCVVLADR